MSDKTTGKGSSLPPRLLLVDQDDMVRLFVAEVLSQHYRVEVARSANEAFDLLGAEAFDLIVTELLLPDDDGLELLKRFQTAPAPPVIVISTRTDDHSRIRALELGARDYLAKPFNPRELLLRIDNCLTYCHETPVEYQVQTLVFQDWTLDLKRRLLMHSRWGEMRLTRAEFDLLATLARGGGTVLSRDALLDAISYGGNPTNDGSLTVLIHRLRRKLVETGGCDDVIQTVSGVGYRLNISSDN